MKTAVEAIHEAMRAQREHYRRTNVQLSLTDEEIPVRLTESDRGESNVAELDAEANTQFQLDFIH